MLYGGGQIWMTWAETSTIANEHWDMLDRTKYNGMERALTVDSTEEQQNTVGTDGGQHWPYTVDSNKAQQNGVGTAGGQHWLDTVDSNEAQRNGASTDGGQHWGTKEWSGR